MEENKLKRARIQKPVGEPITKAKIRTPDKNDKILELAKAGYNINQIGAMLNVHTQYIKDLLK